MRNMVLYLLIVCCASGCASTIVVDDEASQRRSWILGQHLVPPSALQPGQFSNIDEIRDDPEHWGDTVARQKIRPGSKLPAIVYLHGCAGNQNGLYWAQQSGKLGFAFFAPDSLARPRHKLCNRGQMTSLRIPLRTAELNYALARIRSLDWIDQEKLVLVGFSEGAQTAAAYSGTGFAAVVLMGTNCRFSDGSPRVDISIPVLSLMGENDHYYNGVGCTIGRNVGGSKSVVIESAGHNLRNNQIALAELEQFLSRVLLQ